MSLSNYVERIEKAYKEHKSVWHDLQNDLNELTKKYNKDLKKLNQIGVNEATLKYNEKKNEIMYNLAKNRDDFRKDVKDIIKNADKVFNDLFAYNPSKVDGNGLAILHNGGLSPKEIMALAEEYRAQGNVTMYFMYAESLKSNKSVDRMTVDELKAKAYYERAKRQRTERADHELLEGYETICFASLRDDVMTSEGIDSIHDTEYKRYLNGANEIVTDIESPWT